MKFHALLAHSANKLHYVTNVYSRLSLKRKRSVLLIKEKQAIILRLEKEENGTNLSAEYGISKWQISDIHKSKETDRGVCRHVYKYSQRTVNM